jgi:uncharacterized protein
VLPADAVRRLNATLEEFDRTTSNQVVVAIFPELPSPSLEDFTIHTAQAWRAGRPKLSNGVVLFVFVKDRKVRIEVGYGLEGALPDVTARRIIEEQIVPRFRAGDYAGGVEAAVDAIMAATRVEYKPAAAPGAGGSAWPLLLFALVIVIVFVWNASRDPVTTYGRRGRRSSTWWGGPWGGGGWSSGGGGWSTGGGGWSSGGGSSGGFSGGGGSFGGGGASGSW